MRRTFERSTRGAAAPLAVVLTISMIGPAQAGDAMGLPASRCSAGEDCPRIRGHIRAASERAGVETIGGRAATFRPPPSPFVAAIGAAGQAAADTLNRLFFLQQVSHDDDAR